MQNFCPQIFICFEIFFLHIYIPVYLQGTIALMVMYCAAQTVKLCSLCCIQGLMTDARKYPANKKFL